MSPFQKKLEAAREKRKSVLNTQADLARVNVESAQPSPSDDTAIGQAVASLTPPSTQTEIAPPDTAFRRGFEASRKHANILMAFVVGLGLGAILVSGSSLRTQQASPYFNAREVLAPSSDIVTTSITSQALPNDPQSSPAQLAPPAEEPETTLAAIPDLWDDTRPNFASSALPTFDQRTEDNDGDLSDARVFVMLPASLSGTTASALSSAIAGLGVQNSRISQVGYTVSQTHVRFYHPKDAGKAKLIAEASNGIARDFTDFSPKPAAGTLELYIAGGAPVQSPERLSAKNAIDDATDAIEDAAEAIEDVIEAILELD